MLRVEVLTSGSLSSLTESCGNMKQEINLLGDLFFYSLLFWVFVGWFFSVCRFGFFGFFLCVCMCAFMRSQDYVLNFLRTLNIKSIFQYL